MGTHYSVWQFEKGILWMASAQTSRWGHFYYESSRGAGQYRLRCNARLAFVLWAVPARNERLHVDLNRVASLSKLVWHGPADMPQAPRRWGRAPTWRNVMLEPSKQEIEARGYQLWEKADCPKIGKMNFGT
ncbi:hypothetical protein LMTR13_09380 [Bradyrhizobium icense]|uniref:Uncharacterized protein n=1 Tax=Bradyrhizobium icense TaxID=1274631 RepID=A0A1B1UC57_9BRAD|nr:hypothetical protein LMTR13_09380 [Bradyrhizobium icense]